MVWLLSCVGYAAEPLPQLPQLVVVAGAQPLAIHSVLAATRGNRAIDIVLSEADLKCDDLDRYRRPSSKGGERWLAVRLIRQWDDADGPEWTLLNSSSGGTLRDVRKLTVHRVDPNEQVVLDVDLSFAGMRLGAGAVNVTGGIVAKGCGDRPLQEQGPVDGLTATVGEAAVPLHAAWVRNEHGSDQLVLSSQPGACGKRKPWVHADLDMWLTPTDNGKAWEAWSVGGDLFAGRYGTSTPEGLAPLEGAFSAAGYRGRIEMKSWFGGAEVVLLGAVHAGRCP